MFNGSTDFLHLKLDKGILSVAIGMILGKDIESLSLAAIFNKPLERIELYETITSAGDYTHTWAFRTKQGNHNDSNRTDYLKQ